VKAPSLLWCIFCAASSTGCSRNDLNAWFKLVNGGAIITTTSSGKTCFFKSTRNISVSAKSLFIFQFPATIFFLIIMPAKAGIFLMLSIQFLQKIFIIRFNSFIKANFPFGIYDHISRNPIQIYRGTKRAFPSGRNKIIFTDNAIFFNTVFPAIGFLVQGKEKKNNFRIFLAKLLHLWHPNNTILTPTGPNINKNRFAFVLLKNFGKGNFRSIFGKKNIIQSSFGKGFLLCLGKGYK